LWNYRLTAVVAVPYIIVNVRNYFRLIIIITDNLAGLILSRVGCGDLGIYFSNKLSL
jgi:hypothetical protein